MKKIIGIFCFILLGLCLVSCMEEPPIDKPDQGNTEPPSGGKLPDDGKDDTPSVDKQPDDEKDDWEKKIVFWHTMGDSLQKVLQDAIDSFEKANEGWEIESVQFGSMDHILEETISNSNKPDLVYAFPEQVARYKEKGLIVDMNHYIEDENVGFSKDEVDDFIKAFYEEGKSYGDGAMYSLPFSKASEVLYYYKKEASDYPKTWEELEAIEDLNHITLRVESEVLLFTTLAHQSGANYTTLEDNHYVFDNEINRKNVEMLKRLYNQKKLVTANTSASSTYNNKYHLASSGAVYRYITLNTFDELQVAPLPTFRGKARRVPFQGPSLCMVKKQSEKQLKTWEFIRDYLLDSKFQAKFSMYSLYNPVRKSAYEDEDYLEWLKTEEAIASMINICKSYEDDYYFNPPFIGSDNASKEVGNIIVQVLLGKKTIDQAFKDALKNCNSYK